MRCVKVLSLAVLAAGFASPAFATQVEIVNAWFRALPAGLPAAGYFTMNNVGAKDAVLTGASSPACGTLMLHKSMDEGGMGHMVHVKSVSVPVHGTVEFEPGGYHLMCMKPTPAMTPGKSVTVTLTFADGTKTATDFIVKNARGQ